MKKPMLAVDAPSDIKLPVYASVKLDGIRATVQNGRFISRSLTPIPCKWLQSQISKLDLDFAKNLEGLDGELIAGNPIDENCFKNCNSAFMSKDTKDYQWNFYVFDYMTDDKNDLYQFRYNKLLHLKEKGKLPSFVKLVRQRFFNDIGELKKYTLDRINQGHEGVVLRKPDSVYKFGRSTVKQAYMLKIKSMADSECIIKGMVELTKRNKPAGMMGALIVKDLFSGVEFRLGTGFTEQERIDFWQQKQNLAEPKIIKYQFLKVGNYTKPRQPTFIGIRSVLDITI